MKRNILFSITIILVASLKLIAVMPPASEDDDKSFSKEAKVVKETEQVVTTEEITLKGNKKVIDDKNEMVNENTAHDELSYDYFEYDIDPEGHGYSYHRADGTSVTINRVKL